MRCVRCGWPSKNYEMSNDGRSVRAPRRRLPARSARCVVPSSSGPKPAPRAMAALVATPVDATIALQPRSWGAEIDLTCWSQRGAAEPSSDRYEHRTHRDTDQEPPDHPAQRARDPRLRGAPPFPDRGSLVRPAARSLAPAYADLRLRRDETGPVSQGRWLVSLTRWTAANPRPCHWISLMQAEPRY